LTDEDKSGSPEESPQEHVRAPHRPEHEENVRARPTDVEDESAPIPEPEPETARASAPPLNEQPLPPKRRRRWRRGRIACLIGMLAGLGGLVAGRLGVLWIDFDVFAQFTLHFAAILLAFLIGYLMPRARVLTTVAVIIIVIVAIGIWPHVASQTIEALGKPASAEHTLRLMTFNTRLTRHNGNAVAEEVLRNDPDVAILIEFSEDKRSGLDALKARYPYQADCFGIPECYIAIVAKVPFANVESRASWEGPPLIRAHFGDELGGVTVVGVHTIRFPHQRAQLRQIEELVRFLDDIEGPLVVAGDFNATPFSRLLNTFAERSRMSRLTVLPSWPAWFQLPQLAIDHVFAGRGVRATEAARIGKNAGSDHYPVIVGLAVSGP